MAEITGFGDIAPGRVASAAYIGLGSGGSIVPAPLDTASPATTWAELTALIAAYRDADMGYSARRAMQKKGDPGDYDQLARFGEWDITDDPARIRVAE